MAISLIDNLASRGDAAGDSFSSIENLTGSGHRDILRGDNGVNVLSGLDGNDTLEGLGGADTLIGGQGHDTLGQDAFLFDTGLNAATNVDLIVDFNVADDTIRLDDAVFGGLNGGTLAANQFVIGAAAQDGDDRIVYDDATGALFHHLYGAGGAAAVQFATVSAGLALTNLDFFVV